MKGLLAASTWLWFHQSLKLSYLSFTFNVLRFEEIKHQIGYRIQIITNWMENKNNYRKWLPSLTTSIIGQISLAYKSKSLRIDLTLSISLLSLCIGK